MQQLWELTVPAVLFCMCPLELREKQIRGDCLGLLMLLEIPGAASLPSVSGSAFLSFLPGAILLAVSALSQGELGEGDGWLFLALGGSLRPAETWILCQTTLVLAAVAGLLRRRGDSLPLVPFAAPVAGAQALMMAGGAGW